MFFTYGEVIKHRMNGNRNFEAIEDMITISITRIEDFHNLFHYPLDIRNHFFGVISEVSFRKYYESLISLEESAKTQYIQ